MNKKRSDNKSKRKKWKMKEYLIIFLTPKDSNVRKKKLSINWRQRMERREKKGEMVVKDKFKKWILRRKTEVNTWKKKMKGLRKNIFRTLCKKTQW